MTRRAERLIFVNRYFHPDVSATSQMLFDLVNRLAAEGLNVHVVCSRQLYDDPKALLLKREFIFGCEVHRVWTTRFGRTGLLGRAVDYASFYFSSAFRLFRLTRRDDILVAKTDPPLISIVAAIVASLRRARLINWLQDIFPEIASHLDANPLPRWLDGFLRRIRTGSLIAAKANVVLGERMRQHLLGMRVPMSKIRVIENWADGGMIEPLPARATIIRKDLAAEVTFVVGYSGNLGRAHDYRTFLDAGAALRDEPGILFLMIGGGVNMRHLEEEVAELKLRNFRFMPYQAREDLGASLAAADIHLACLLPALEGLIVPSKLYGILAAGRPIIFVGDPDGDVARVIRSSGCGSVVGMGDGPALVTEIQRYRANPHMLCAAGGRARRIFDEEYTIDIAARKWRELLLEVKGSC
jgi:colanic acid biosynthesis glycosyl transferase WcaI